MDHGRILALDTPAGLKRGVGADTIVTVTADGKLDELAHLLEARVPGVTQATRVDSTVQLGVKGAEGVLPAVVNAAENGGFTVTDLSIAEPTLETVFINLTGKDLRD
jgi:ABC-2 type transport system ATP-binding protein